MVNAAHLKSYITPPTPDTDDSVESSAQVFSPLKMHFNIVVHVHCLGSYSPDIEDNITTLTTLNFSHSNQSHDSLNASLLLSFLQFYGMYCGF